MRLLTDTCAALKLAAFGITLFESGKLTSGDLVLHPIVFTETKKWLPFKKEKYKAELAILAKVRATPALRPPNEQLETLETIIHSTMDELGLSIGKADREQLASAIHSKIHLVTNDQPFAQVAEALEVNVYSAEKITVEAFSEAVVTKADVIAARARWKTNNEKLPTKDESRELDRICQ